MAALNLAFSSLELRTLCECQAAAERTYGIVVARELRARLADMREATTVLELLAGNPHEVEDGRHRCYQVGLPEDFRIVVCANHDPLPRHEGTGGVEWSRVTRVKITRIERVEVHYG